MSTVRCRRLSGGNSDVDRGIDPFGEPDKEIFADYAHVRTLPDGRPCGVKRLLFHWTIHVHIHAIGYEDRYCYATMEGAVAALDAWDGTGDPNGWHKHPSSGRRRDPETGETWSEHEFRPDKQNGR